MKESPILKGLFARLGRSDDLILFRNNSGMGWAGKLVHKVKERTGFTVVLHNARPLHAGLTKRGSLDVIGIKTIEITPEMVGKKVGLFLSLDTKSLAGPIREEQGVFHENVIAAGGISGFPRSPEEAEKIISDHVKWLQS